ncbi:formylmethanofuran dehydrogenase subunit C [Methanobacterium movens]
MSEIILTPKKQPQVPLETPNIKPDVFAGKTIDEIKELEINYGNEKAILADFFDIEGTPAETAGEIKIIIDGDVSKTKRIGQQMTAGEILVKGDVYMYVGLEMEGGKITVQGDAAAWAGQDMKGGELEIMGDAGDYAGSSYRGDWRGMSGGLITIHGDVGFEIAEYMGGGKIVVKGNADHMPGIHMNNGVLIIEGNVTSRTGGEMVGGTIVVKGVVGEFLPGFSYWGIEKNIQVGGEEIHGVFYKFTGDNAMKGAKGTIYVAVSGNKHVAPE